jgi:hypothetical protein
LERKGFFYTLPGWVLAVIAGRVVGIFPRSDIADTVEPCNRAVGAWISTLSTKVAAHPSKLDPSVGGVRIAAFEITVVKPSGEVSLKPVEARISDLESKVAEQTDELKNLSASEPIAYLEGGNNRLVVFDREELSIINPDRVLLNLAATNVGYGSKVSQDFCFGNEKRQDLGT